jgi:hypothetical protein
VGLASPTVRGEQDRELTFKVGDGATGLGTTMGVRDTNGGTVSGIEAKGRVGNGVGTMARHRGRQQRHRERWRRLHDVKGGDGAEGGKLG